MCGGGGGGGVSAETRALQEQQLKQAQQDEQRRTIEEQRRLNAVQQINALYGMQSKAADVDAYNKALGSLYDLDNPGGLISTHSRAKAAGRVMSATLLMLTFQLTAARRRLGRDLAR